MTALVAGALLLIGAACTPVKPPPPGPVSSPSAPDLDPGSDSGTSSTDDVTNDTNPLVVGTAPAGTLVTILADGVPVGSNVSFVGSYAVELTFPEGVSALTAVATNSEGQTSEPSSALVVTIDTTAPAVTLTEPEPGANENGVIGLAGAAGTGPGDLPAIVVNIYHASSATGMPALTHADEAVAGEWDFLLTPSADHEGTLTAQATQTDTAGNVGLSNTTTFTYFQS